MTVCFWGLRDIWVCCSQHRPGPLGLSLGLLAVAVGMLFVLLYHRLRLWGCIGELVPIQVAGAPNYAFGEGVMTHIAQPEGFALLGGYLIGTWMFNLMPASYYHFTGGCVRWVTRPSPRNPARQGHHVHCIASTVVFMRLYQRCRPAGMTQLRL